MKYHIFELRRKIQRHDQIIAVMHTAKVVVKLKPGKSSDLNTEA